MQGGPELKFDLIVYAGDHINSLRVSYPMKHMTAWQHKKLIELTNNFIIRLTGEKKSQSELDTAVEEANKQFEAAIHSTGKSI